MEQTMSALKATGKLKFLAMMFALSVLIIYKFALFPFSAYIAAFFLTVIVAEDYFFHVIDMRIIAVMFLFGLLANDNPAKFLATAAIVFLVFDNVRLATVKFAEISRSNLAGNGETFKELAFVPVLAAALFLYLFLDMVFVPEYATFPIICEMFSASQITMMSLSVEDVLCAITFLLAANFLLRYRIKTNAGLLNAPRFVFGEGDSYVMALLAAFLGVFDFLMLYMVTVVLLCVAATSRILRRYG